ncbi:Activator of Hsp90 ATPase [Giardia muris]|uniref:Activator of Hsp90 ATPase n=1 Tax=Giardia muris TaxID=5742 RepID=A0A4Z1SNZ0_GIAMU|nr:Activator of Hsp90 ATPase [Giardia muris]|eukprot:TNJ27350.1 Activator of Hsp90 ATPase [Giardia muris]
MESNAHNINGWHWSEKDFTEWATKTLKEKLVFEEPGSSPETAFKTRIDEIRGEAFKNVRKGKLRTSYDFKVKLIATIGPDEGSDAPPVECLVTYEPFCDSDPADWEFDVRVKDPAKHSASKVAEAKKLIRREIFEKRVLEWIELYNQQMD